MTPSGLQPDFIQIPQPVLVDRELQLSDKIVFGYVYWMTKLALQKCIASNSTLAAYCGVSERNIQLSLVRLEQQGYIRRIYADGNANHREEIECRVAYSAQRTTVRGGTNHSSQGVRTTVHHIKNTYKEDLKRNRVTVDNSEKGKASKQPTSEANTALSPELDSFMEMRQVSGRPLTARALTLLLSQLEEWYPGTAALQRKCLAQSVMNGWSSIQQLKGSPKDESGGLTPDQILHPERYAK